MIQPALCRRSASWRWRRGGFISRPKVAGPPAAWRLLRHLRQRQALLIMRLLCLLRPRRENEHAAARNGSFQWAAPLHQGSAAAARPADSHGPRDTEACCAGTQAAGQGRQARAPGCRRPAARQSGAVARVMSYHADCSKCWRCLASRLPSCNTQPALRCSLAWSHSAQPPTRWWSQTQAP